MKHSLLSHLLRGVRAFCEGITETGILGLPGYEFNWQHPGSAEICLQRSQLLYAFSLLISSGSPLTQRKVHQVFSGAMSLSVHTYKCIYLLLSL